ncbi:EpsG family protein [Cronobacter turicensis]|nr:EpsG family protein [Cronobacter turicensis]EKY3179747.1 EpsG family protein [Cronobacter turicensis]
MIRIFDLFAILSLIVIYGILISIKRKSNAISFLLFCLACVIISLRTIGDDTAEYIDIYTSLSPGFSWGDMILVNGFRIEPIWGNFISLLKYAGFQTHYLFFFLSVLLPSLAIIWVSKKWNGIDARLSALFYFVFLLILYQYLINGVRAFAASCVILLALWFLYKRQYVKLLITSFIAVLLHTSALIVIPFIILFKIRLQKKHVAYSLVLFIFSLLALSQIDWQSDFILHIVSKLDYYLYSVENDMVSQNVGRELYVYFARSVFISSIVYSIFLLLLAIDSYQQDDFVRGLYNCTAFTLFICVCLMCCGIFLFSYRLLQFAGPLLVLIVTHSLYSSPKRFKFPFFIVFSGFYWFIFILYASRFYDK